VSHFSPHAASSGLSIHTFHGNFFVRSTDLLSLANVNPDSAFAVQMSIDDSLADSSLACFQAALLYTSSKGAQPCLKLVDEPCSLVTMWMNLFIGHEDEPVHWSTCG